MLGGTIGLGGVAYQVIKKTREATQMAHRREYDAAMKELLGAIVYAASCYHHVEKMKLEEGSRHENFR